MKDLTPLQIIEAAILLLLVVQAILVYVKKRRPIIEDFEKHYSEN